MPRGHNSRSGQPGPVAVQGPFLRLERGSASARSPRSRRRSPIFPDPQERAQRIRRFLRQLFEKTYAFSLEALTKKPLKEALKVLHAFEAFSSDYVTATVIQQALGGHAIPVDAETRRALDRLGIHEPDVHALRSVLERAVPKNRGVEFVELLEELAHDTCVPGDPDCPRCELRKMCPFAQTRKQAAHAAAHPHAHGKAGSAAKSAAAPALPAEKASKKKESEKEKSKGRPAPAPAPAPPSKNSSAKGHPPVPKSSRGKRAGGK